MNKRSSRFQPRFDGFQHFAEVVFARWKPAEIQRNPGRVGFPSEVLNRLLEFGAHLPEMVLVFNFPIAELVNDMGR